MNSNCKPILEKTCSYCNTRYTTYPCHAKRKYCSNLCRLNAVANRKVPFTCPFCQTIIYVFPSRIRYKKSCGKDSCKKQAFASKKIGTLNPMYTGAGTVVPCIMCGTLKKVYASFNTFCSLACKGLWQATHLKDTANPFYGKHHTEQVKRQSAERNRRGNMRSINNSLRNTNKMQEWRKAVFARDNWTCSVCLSRSTKGQPVTLHAHHIISVAELIQNCSFKDMYSTDPISFLHNDYFYNIDNGITVCVDCHYTRKHQVRRN